MRFVMVTTRFIIIGLKIQTLDFQVFIIAPVAIGCLSKIIILIVISDVQLLNLSILQVELEDLVFRLFLLLGLLVLLGGIQKKLIVGRTVFWFDD